MFNAYLRTMSSPSRCLLALTFAGIISCDRSPTPTGVITAAQSSPRQTATGYYSERLGIVVAGLMDASKTDEQVRRELGFAKQAGAGYVREVFYWDHAQPSGPTFDPGWLALADRFVQAAADSGLKPYITFQQSPDWARLCPGPDCSVAKVSAPPHPSMFIWWQNFVRDVVARYDGNQRPYVKYWGVWNEPNEAGFLDFTGYPNWFEPYYLLFLYAADVIQPQGRCFAGPELGWGQSSRGWTPEAEFAEFVNRLGYRFTGGGSCGVLTVHFYGTPSNLTTAMNNFRQSASNAYIANDLWVTELGDGTPEMESNDAEQTWVLNDQVRAMFSLHPNVKWTKSFKFHLSLPPGHPEYNRSLVYGASTVNPVIRPAFYCFQSYALFGNHYLYPNCLRPEEP